jgi:hypothetical protein
VANFARRLRRESRSLVLARSFGALVSGFLAWSGLLVLLDLYDAYSPIQETDASAWITGAAAISILCFLFFFVRFWINRPNPVELARQVETTHPQLKDLLNTAIEIESKGKDPGIMERRVLRHLEKKAHLMDWGNALRPSSSFLNYLLFGFLAGVILSIWNLNRSPLIKARAVMSGEDGLVVWTALSGSTENLRREASAEYRRGADIAVRADVVRGHRGTKEAWVEWKEGNQTVVLSMLPTEIPGRLEFVLPSLQKAVRYRVNTPSIQSEWFEVTPFDPPSLEFARWEITPPSYLKMKPIIHEGFGYIEAPENSMIRLDVRVKDLPKEISARLVSEDNNFTLDKVGRVTFSWSGKINTEWSARLALSDSAHPDRPKVIHDLVTFSPIPDEPPVVEISEPAKDLELPFDAEPLLIEVFAADDHGVSDLRLHVSHDGEKSEQSLFVNPVEKEKSVTGILDLSEYPLAVGDVITYIAFAVDNREPDNQLARSEIYFIEILPEQSEGEDQSQGEMPQDEVWEIPIRKFINLTKKIIRSTYDSLSYDKANQESVALDLGNEARHLKGMMTIVYDDHKEKFPFVDGLDSAELFLDSIYQIEQTEISLGELEFTVSLESSENALRKLVMVYALLSQSNETNSFIKELYKDE